MSLQIEKLNIHSSSYGHNLQQIAQKYRDFFVSLRKNATYKKPKERYQKIRGYSNGNVGSACIKIEDRIFGNPYVAFSSLDFEEELKEIKQWFIAEAFNYSNETIALWKDGKTQIRNFIHQEVNTANIPNGDGAYPRFYDSEFKILDRIIDDLSNLNVDKQKQIHIYLYTFKFPCFGCQDVFNQLGKLGYKNLNLSVYWEKELS